MVTISSLNWVWLEKEGRDIPSFPATPTTPSMKLIIENPQSFSKELQAIALEFAAAFFRRIDEEGLSNPKADAEVLSLTVRSEGSVTHINCCLQESQISGVEIWTSSVTISLEKPDELIAMIGDGNKARGTVRNIIDYVAGVLIEDLDEKIDGVMIGLPE